MASIDDDVSSSGEDIPAKQDKQKKKEPTPDEDEEDEYVVEGIEDHMFKGKKLFYKVRWEGYPKEDDKTWEPEENIAACEDELQEYYEKIGGKPERTQKPSKSTPVSAKPSTKRRHTDDSDTTSPSATTRAGRPTGKKARTGNGRQTITSREMRTPNGGEVTWTSPPGSWEDEIVHVETMERDKNTGDLRGFVTWNNGHKSIHSTKLLNKKCPQKMLAFYESHLFFTKDEKPTDDQPAPTEPPTEPPIEPPVKAISETPAALGMDGEDLAMGMDGNADDPGVQGLASVA